MLLAPHCRLAVDHDLSSENAFHATVKSLGGTLSELSVGEIAVIRSHAVRYVTQHIHGVDHRVVIVGDMHLIAARIGPELRPAAILILPGKKILHSPAECVAIPLVAGRLIHPGEE